MRPIIGLFAEIDDEMSTRILRTYIEAVEGAGGLPILLPYVKGEDAIFDFIKLCDGFVFTGGADIDPSHYGEEKLSVCGEIRRYRDELEFRAAQEVMKTDKPVLAICRGAQLINVVLGGTLYQDLPTQKPSDIRHQQIQGKFEYSHHVNVLPNTPLYSLLKTTKIKANSFHHQAIKNPGKDLEIMAEADDGTVEAAYLKGERYLRAYQWHPERLFNADALHPLIFSDFVHACAT